MRVCGARTCWLWGAGLSRYGIKISGVSPVDVIAWLLDKGQMASIQEVGAQQADASDCLEWSRGRRRLEAYT